jgi:hypothetical protein
MLYELEVFSLDVDYMDLIAWSVDPIEKWKRCAWSEGSYVYSFDNREDAIIFFCKIRSHACVKPLKANTSQTPDDPKPIEALHEAAREAGADEKEADRPFKKVVERQSPKK